MKIIKNTKITADSRGYAKLNIPNVITELMELKKDDSIKWVCDGKKIIITKEIDNESN